MKRFKFFQLKLRPCNSLKCALVFILINTNAHLREFKLMYSLEQVLRKDK